VDVIDQIAPRSLARLLDLAGAVVSFGMLAVMAWQMLPVARSMYEFGDVTSDLSIPKIYYWIPVLLGVLGSAAATLAFIVRWRRRP
jgi:TRAP-type C4-dicarboxylate transport system permease small subunit